MIDEKLQKRLEDMRDFCEGAVGTSRPHPNNVARLCRDVLAALPCQTKGPEDAESGCCAPCRARSRL